MGVPENILTKVQELTCAVSPVSVETKTTKCIKGYSKTLMEITEKEPLKMARFTRDFFNKMTESKVTKDTSLKFMRDHMKLYDFVLDWDKNSIIVYKKEV